MPRRKATYKVVRMYKEDHPDETIKTGLSRGAALAHCKDPETSSSTCKLPENVQRTRERGPWFDGFEVEK